MLTWLESIGPPAVIIFVGVLISAFGALWASQQQASFLTWLESISPPAVIIFVGVLISAFGAFWASQQQSSFERNLREKSEEIARLNQELAKSVIGGDSFCYLEILSLNPVTNVGILTVKHQGEYHLYDVHARIGDLEKLDQLKGNLSFATLATLNQINTNISIGNLTPSHGLILQQVSLGNGDTRAFNIFFSARNGSFTQLLRFKKVNGKWVRATKVERENELLYEKVDDEFPRTTEGGVEW